MEKPKIETRRTNWEAVSPIRYGTFTSVELSTPRGRTIINGQVVDWFKGRLRVKTRVPISSYHVAGSQRVDVWFPYLRDIAPLKAVAAQIDITDPDMLWIEVPAQLIRPNRRMALRADFKIPVEVANFGSIQFFEGETVNIGGGGVMLKVSKQVDVNETVHVTLSMPDSTGGVLSADADVVWSSPGEEESFVGLRFKGMDADQLKRLCRMTIRKRAADHRTRRPSETRESTLP